MKGPVFITGNSRSGTTMMMRIMDKHSLLHSINEPHFFGTHWSPSDEGIGLSRAETERLLFKLLTVQRAGFFESVSEHSPKFKDEVTELVDRLHGADPPSRVAVYETFLYHEASVNGKVVPCEKTPQNIFYIQEILDHFPEARIVNMVRDPRGTMLSQKNKWKRRALGADFMTAKEVRRLKANYHPITMSRLWKSAIDTARRWKGTPAVMNVRFESLLSDAEATLREVCSHIGIPFEADMMDIPHAGSSLKADEHTKRGIRKPTERTWQEKGLLPAELHWCQKICAAGMKEHGYEPVETHAGTFSIIASAMTFPFKVILALMLNLSRVRNLVDTIKRRLKG